MHKMRAALEEAISTMREVLEDPEVLNVYKCHIDHEDVDRWQSTLTPSPWIPCSERLPTESKTYLIFANDIVSSWQCTANYADGKWWVGGEEYPPIVTHWMELPEPPGEKE